MKIFKKLILLLAVSAFVGMLAAGCQEQTVQEKKPCDTKASTCPKTSTTKCCKAPGATSCCKTAPAKCRKCGMIGGTKACCPKTTTEKCSTVEVEGTNKVAPTSTCAPCGSK